MTYLNEQRTAGRPDATGFALWAAKVESRGATKFGPLLLLAYRIALLRRPCLALVRRLEGGEMYSQTLRRLLERYYGVAVGLGSYGPCLKPLCLPKGTIVGNYCSVAEGLRVFRRNHPVDHLSQHPYFYNRHLGLVGNDMIMAVTDNPLTIGHDVWIGSDVTILPGCRLIGNGAVIGAGSIVTRDIEPYAIVAGNPARIVRKRFPDDVQVLVERSRWWELPPSRLAEMRELLFAPVTKSRLEEVLGQFETKGP